LKCGAVEGWRRSVLTDPVRKRRIIVTYSQAGEEYLTNSKIEEG
jgi:hypothetical protein